MQKDAVVYNLENGLRIIHKHFPHSRMVHCGFIVDAGTSNENSKNNGVSHLIEHGVFKGTRNRKPYQLLNRMESVGGDIEAFTTREKTYYFTASLNRYAERSVELLVDLLFNPVFPEDEMDKEKRVIKEEIEMYEDMPEESLIDDFHWYMFPDHPLGYNILGTKKTLREINRNTLLDFYNDHYHPANIVVSITGKITSNKVQKLIDRYLAPLNTSKNPGKISLPSEVKPFNKTLSKEFHQSYCVLGSRAYSRHHEKRYVLSLLNTILGGTGMSSRLNLSIREKYGYVYQIDSSFIPYKDTGLFSVDFSTDSNTLDKCLDLIYKEFKKLRERKLGTVQLNRAKRQLKGQAAMMEENHSALMQTLGRNLMDYSKAFSIDHFFEKIDEVTSSDILEVANEILDEDQLSMLIYKPSD